MLHKIILENYRSFGTRGEISLYPNPKRTFYPSHIYSGEELLYPVLKHCLIVGPNASGKTNLVKGMKFIKEFCCGQQHHDPKDKWLNRWYYDNRFNLPVAEDEAPIHFMIEFSKGGKYYEYSVNFDGDGIKTESLYLVRGNRLRPQVIFLRCRDKVDFSKEINATKELDSLFHQQFKNNPETSLLVLNANFRYLDNADIINAQTWFRNNLEVSCEDMSMPRLMDLYCKTPRIMQFTNAILKQMGIGCTVAIAEFKPSDWLRKSSNTMDRSILNFFEGGEISPSIHSYDAPDFIIRTTGSRKVIREIEFIHTGVNGYELRTKASEESSGTIHMLTVLALLYQSIYNGKSCIIDGLDLNVNAVTFRDLLKYYCETESNGQIIYTANTLMTMNQQEMTRLDEVNLLEKKDGSSQIIALDKLPNIKTLLSLERNYLDGRFGGRPGLISAESLAGNKTK